MELFELDGAGRKLISEYSKGMKRARGHGRGVDPPA